MRHIFFSLLLFLCYRLQAQQPICMDYDNAGNRIQRLVCGSGIMVPGDGSEVVEAAKTQDEESAERANSASLVTGQIVPNPNDGRFDIALNRSVEGGRFELYGTQGELLLQQPAQGERNTFYLRDLPSGNYYLLLKSAGQALGQWLVLKH